LKNNYYNPLFIRIKYIIDKNLLLILNNQETAKRSEGLKISLA